MFEKAKVWCKKHPEAVAFGGFIVTYAAGVAVGRYTMRKQVDTNLTSMILADPTFLDHMKKAHDAAVNTVTQINNF